MTAAASTGSRAARSPASLCLLQPAGEEGELLGPGGADLLFGGRLDESADAEDLALDLDLVAATASPCAGRLDPDRAARRDDLLARDHSPGPFVAGAIERAVLLVGEAVADQLLQHAGQ